MQLRCFTLPYLYCTYSPAIAHPHYSPWFTWFISYFGLNYVPPFLPLPLLKSLGIPGQRHVKAIRQKVSEVFFSGHWGESKRLQRSVTKTGRCCGSVLYPPPLSKLAHTGRSTCTHTQTHTYTDKQPHMV